MHTYSNNGIVLLLGTAHASPTTERLGFSYGLQSTLVHPIRDKDVGVSLIRGEAVGGKDQLGPVRVEYRKTIERSRAYFVDGRDISDAEVLVDIAATVGLSANAARTVLEERSFQAAIDADWARSRSYGITGVPTFVAGGYGVVGAQPYEALEQLLQRAETAAG